LLHRASNAVVTRPGMLTTRRCKLCEAWIARDEQQTGRATSSTERIAPEKSEIEYIPIVVNHGSRSRANSRSRAQKGTFLRLSNTVAAISYGRVARWNTT